MAGAGQPVIGSRVAAAHAEEQHRWIGSRWVTAEGTLVDLPRDQDRGRKPEESIGERQRKTRLAVVPFVVPC